MHTFKGKWSVVYLNILKRIKEQGEILAKNKCIFNLNFEISPDDILILKEKNWKWALVELFDRFNPQYVNPGFSYNFRPHWKRKLISEGGKFCYNYNERISKQLDDVFNLLNSNKKSKHAVITVFNSEDLLSKLRVPCTLSLHFYTNKRNALDMHVNMRTNDVVNLLIYDVFHHAMIQRFLASRLRLDLGTYSHHCSIAYYQKKRENIGYIDRLINSGLTSEKVPKINDEFYLEFGKAVLNLANKNLDFDFKDKFVSDFYNVNQNLLYNTKIPILKLNFFRSIFNEKKTNSNQDDEA